MKNKNVINIEQTNEIAIAKLRASYGNMATGYCEEEADALRAKILNAPNTQEVYEIRGTTYYVSANGDDQNDGLSPEKPIKSLDRIEKLELKNGDAILFERGSIFRFKRTMNIVNGITYGCYGEGVKPALYGSPENYALNDSWEEVKPNIWKIDFPYEYASGCILDYGMIAGVQKWDTKFDGMKENGDYFHDLETNNFYLYSKGKPSEVWHDIEIMPTFSLIMMRDTKDVVIDNICMKYAAGFGISAPDTQGNIKITNCELGYLGGLWEGVKPGGRVRFGNAIEFWAGAKDTIVENCWFYQTYDSALTWQGSGGKYGQWGIEYINITYRENLFEYNNADIEFFAGNNFPLENFRMEDNIMRFTSMGWGSRTYDGGYRGIEGCVRAVTGGGARILDVKSAYFLNNLMDCPARQTMNWNVEPWQLEKIHASGTRLYIKSEYRTLEPCLQGLQNQPGLPYDRRFACNKQELIEGYEIFEKDADIRWDEHDK
ncbi:MAG: hypothetical protein E7537_05100 [Ruminococcaceae bacterium]|nr:hypothetical protein [Oscillospiraceae bacterium]